MEVEPALSSAMHGIGSKSVKVERTSPSGLWQWICYYAQFQHCAQVLSTASRTEIYPQYVHQCDEALRVLSDSPMVPSSELDACQTSKGATWKQIVATFDEFLKAGDIGCSRMLNGKGVRFTQLMGCMGQVMKKLLSAKLTDGGSRGLST